MRKIAKQFPRVTTQNKKPTSQSKKINGEVRHVRKAKTKKANGPKAIPIRNLFFLLQSVVNIRETLATRIQRLEKEERPNSAELGATMIKKKSYENAILGVFSEKGIYETIKKKADRRLWLGGRPQKKTDWSSANDKP